MKQVIKWIKEKLVADKITDYKGEEGKTLYITKSFCGIKARITEEDEDNPHKTYITISSEDDYCEDYPFVSYMCFGHASKEDLRKLRLFLNLATETLNEEEEETKQIKDIIGGK